LTPRSIGEFGGSKDVFLNVSEIPSHTHAAKYVDAEPTQSSPTEAYWSDSTEGRKPPDIYSSKFDTVMNSQAIGVTGGGHPHNNMQPYLGINYIIALQGVFPSRG
jgi:microcystin-dependent protein